MKKYRVYVSRHEAGSTVVEAEDKEQAKQLVEDRLDDYYEEIFPPAEAEYSFEAEELRDKDECFKEAWYAEAAPHKTALVDYMDQGIIDADMLAREFIDYCSDDDVKEVMNTLDIEMPEDEDDDEDYWEDEIDDDFDEDFE